MSTTDDMKVRVLSDLHLEFGDNYDPGTGDILVLAGDICNASEYEKYSEFFDKCVKGYQRVLYVLGNHEHYYGDFDKSFWLLKQQLPKDVIVLHNTSVLIDGVHFIGATFWTDMNNMDRILSIPQERE